MFFLLKLNTPGMTRTLESERDVGEGSKLEVTKLSKKINGLPHSVKR